jgi:hypothetical protein
MLLAVVTTIYLAFVLFGLGVLFSEDQLPINRKQGVGESLISACSAGLYLWWCVSNVGWQPATVALLILNAVSLPYILFLTARTGRVYYPVWATLLAVGIMIWIDVVLWVAV